MRAMNAKAGLVFCLSGMGLYGCTALLDLGDNTYSDNSVTGSASSSGSGTGGAGGGGGGGAPVSQLAWGIRVEGTQDIQINSIAAASDGSVWITGRFKGELIFADGGEKIDLASLSVTAFWAKFGSNGKVIAAQTVDTGISGQSSGDGIAVDSFGNAYIVGTFSKTVTFPKDTAGQNQFFTSSGDSDIFLTKVNSNAVPVTIHQLGGTGAEEATDIALNTVQGAQYDLAISGFFTGTFEYLSSSIPSTGANDGFVLVCKNLDSDPLSIPWISLLGSAKATTNEAVRGVAILPDESIALVGNCGETPTLASSSPPVPVTSTGTHVCTGRLNGTMGNVITTSAPLFSVGDWEAGKTGVQEGLGIAYVNIDKISKLALVGTFQGQLDFCGQSKATPNPSASVTNGFMSLVNDSDFGDANNLLINLGGNMQSDANEAITSVAAGEDDEIYISGSIQSDAFLDIDMQTQPPIMGNNAVFINKLTRSGPTYKVEGGILSGPASSEDIALKKISYSAFDHSILGTGHYKGKLNYRPQKSSVNELIELPEVTVKTAYIVKLDFKTLP